MTSESLLYVKTLQAIQCDFRSFDHKPSGKQWNALKALIGCLEGIVEGRSDPKVYLSSLDPGIGKTTTLIKFLGNLLESQRHAHVGVLICISTLEEIERLIDEADIPAEMLTVWTSDDRLNALGMSPTVDQARVLITTHARMELELDGNDFWTVDKLYFKGAPRKLRVWDEAFVPGTPISLNTDDVYFLLRALTSINRDLRDDIKVIFDEIEKLSDGSLYKVPDFMSNHGIILNQLMGTVSGDPTNNSQEQMKDEQRKILTSLSAISGKTVRVRQDGAHGNTAVDYHETMPTDLAPLVVLDASGRVRVLYEDLETRKIVKRLPEAPKSYRNLTVHLWQRGGGKGAWQSHGGDLLQGIVRTIRKRPEEEWLIIHHKRDKRVGDIEKKLSYFLNGSGVKLHFMTWGRHKAVNKFSHVTNIILAGTLFLRPSQYEALKRLAVGRKPEHGRVNSKELNVFKLGEHSNDILQALCRGAVRKSLDDTCPKCDAYIIASVRSGIKEALPEIFPECALVPWEPLPHELHGRVAEAYGLIRAWVRDAEEGDTLPFKNVAKRLGIDRRDFKSDVRAHEHFQSAIAQLGVTEWGKNKYFTAFRFGNSPGNQ